METRLEGGASFAFRNETFVGSCTSIVSPFGRLFHRLESRVLFPLRLQLAHEMLSPGSEALHPFPGSEVKEKDAGFPEKLARALEIGEGEEPENRKKPEDEQRGRAAEEVGGGPPHESIGDGEGYEGAEELEGRAFDRFRGACLGDPARDGVGQIVEDGADEERHETQDGENEPGKEIADYRSDAIDAVEVAVGQFENFKSAAIRENLPSEPRVVERAPVAVVGHGTDESAIDFESFRDSRSREEGTQGREKLLVFLMGHVERQSSKLVLELGGERSNRVRLPSLAPGLEMSSGVDGCAERDERIASEPLAIRKSDPDGQDAGAELESMLGFRFEHDARTAGLEGKDEITLVAHSLGKDGDGAALGEQRVARGKRGEIPRRGGRGWGLVPLPVDGKHARGGEKPRENGISKERRLGEEMERPPRRGTEEKDVEHHVRVIRREHHRPLVGDAVGMLDDELAVKEVRQPSGERPQESIEKRGPHGFSMGHFGPAVEWFAAGGADGLEHAGFMRIFILGAGEVGYHIASSLSLEGHDLVVIEADAERAQRVQSTLDVMSVAGDGCEPDLLLKYGVKNADLFFSVSDSDTVNLLAALTARRLGAKRCIARLGNPAYGENQLILDDPYITPLYPERLVAEEILGLTRVAGVSKAHFFEDGKLLLLRTRPSRKADVFNRPLRDLKGPEGWILVGVEKGMKLSIPRGDTVLRPGQRVYAVGRTESATEFLKAVGVESPPVKKVVIAGAGHVGSWLARKLVEDHVQVTVIQRHPGRALALATDVPGALVLQGDALDVSVLNEAGAGDADYFVAATQEDETNVISSYLAREAGARNVVSLYHRPEFVNVLRAARVDIGLSPRIITAGTILRMVHRREILSLDLVASGDAEVVEFQVPDASRVLKKPLRELKIPKGAIVGAVIRGEERYVPGGDFVFQVGDRALVFSLTEALPRLEKMFRAR